MTDGEESKEGKQETKTASSGVTQPATTAAQPPSIPQTTNANDGPKPSEPILVRLVGDNDPTPFEKQTVDIANETLKITKRGYRITMCGFLAALAAAVFVGIQVREMSYQTQIMGTQSESAASSAAMGELSARKQLSIAQQQAQAAQDSVAAIRRQMRQDQRPWIRFDLGDPNGPSVTWRTQVGGPLSMPTRFTNIGKTPAEAVRIFAIIEVVPAGHEPHVPKYFSSVRAKKSVATAVIQVEAGAIFPTSHMNQMVTRVTIGKRGQATVRNLSVAEANDLVNKRAYLAVYGKVEYADVFGFKHWTRFCKDGYTDGEDGNSGKCAHYYAVDNN